MWAAKAIVVRSDDRIATAEDPETHVHTCPPENLARSGSSLRLIRLVPSANFSHERTNASGD